MLSGTKMIGKLWIDGGRDRHHAACADEQGVAISRLAGDKFGRDAAACGRPVFDHQRLAEDFAELLPHQARKDIVTAARSERDDDADRLVGITGGGIILRLQRCRRSEQCCQHQGAGEQA
jgi:hypothetical protein